MSEDQNDVDTLSSEEATAQQPSAEDLPEPVSEQGDETEQTIETLRTEVKENFDKYLRALAETENIRKRAARERQELLRYAGENLARDLLEVVDDLERALAQTNVGSGEEMKKGVELIYERLQGVLRAHSITSKSSVGEPFDPNTQAALISVDRSDVAAGSVVEELKKAYFFKDKLLRPAQVVVAASPKSEEEEE